MSERNRILMEASRITAEDEYFAARPQLDGWDRRRVFQAGFERAWEAAMIAYLDQFPDHNLPEGL